MKEFVLSLRLIFIASLGLISSPLLANAQSADNTEAYKLQVPIFDYAQSQNIAEYIAKIYQYTMIVLIPILIVIIILGGLSWVAAAGDNGRIKKAKDRITSGFIGLGIALFSYILLSLVGINALNLPGLEKIEPEVGDDLIMYSGSGTMPGTPGSYASVGGQCFPVASGSFDYNSHNFRDSRTGSRGHCNRNHAGVDLITKEPGIGLAIADGVVTHISTTFKPGCSRGWFVQKYGPETAGAILIYHPSLNVTVNYGEVQVGSLKVKAGDNVTAGQVLGVWGPCRMIHFEMYQGKTSTTKSWCVGAPQPTGLLDPTNTLQDLQSKICGGA